MTEETEKHLREVSLKMSRDLNPNTSNPSQGYSFGGQYNTIPPTIDKVLSDADKIFDWLTK